MKCAKKKASSHESTAFAVVVGVLMTAFLTVVQGSGVLPLRGQESPMYGTIQSASVSSQRLRGAAQSSATSVVSSVRSSARVSSAEKSSSMARSSPSSMRSSAKVSSSAAKKTSSRSSTKSSSFNPNATVGSSLNNVAPSGRGRSAGWFAPKSIPGCYSNGTANTTMTGMTPAQQEQALYTCGNLSCFNDANCQGLLQQCGEIRHSGRPCDGEYWLWAMHSFFPECTQEKRNEECARGAALLLSKDAPKPIKDCVRDVACRELLTTFRQTNFYCRMNTKCIEALEAILAQPYCETFVWCKTLGAIQLTYDMLAKNCKDPASAACRKQIGVELYARAQKRLTPCEKDERSCKSRMEDMATALLSPNADVTNGGVCFLFDYCKQQFYYTHSIVCVSSDAYGQELCEIGTRVIELLTKNAPQCMYESSQKCLEAIRRTKKG